MSGHDHRNTHISQHLPDNRILVLLYAHVRAVLRLPAFSLDIDDQTFCNPHRKLVYAMKPGRIRSWEFLEGSEVRCVPLKSTILVNDADTYVACRLAGLGLIQGSTFIPHAHVRSGQLSKVLRDYPLNPRPVSVVYMPNRTRPKRVDIFIDWLVDVYSVHLADQS